MQFSADINRPFNWSIAPRKYWNADARVRSFMIEVRRDLYMDEETGIRCANFSVASSRAFDLRDPNRIDAAIKDVSGRGNVSPADNRLAGFHTEPHLPKGVGQIAPRPPRAQST
jgi:hypothetical protein